MVHRVRSHTPKGEAFSQKIESADATDTPPTLTSFSGGDLVVSISGEGYGSETFTDNQATPITLAELSPGAYNAATGTFGAATTVGQLILPQSEPQGSTQNVISGEYGSSSEGSLELSADGKSLTIAGYGVNADTYNAGESNGNNVYGNAALAQSTSNPNNTNGYTAVSRVVADVRFNGNVDTSTALYNIYDGNNPRSAVTTDGSSFYVSGQGSKSAATQGVVYTADGNPNYTQIYNNIDTRTAELYNGTLYVSADSSQSKGHATIYSFGGTPTTGTTPTPLSGMTGSLTLTAAQENSVNAGAVGTSVDLSPENFFFASPTTLYVADSGNPKGKTIGDGGLQKWTYNGSTWKLQYTLSNGLNLVDNPNANSNDTAGTTGLIGLTGKVNSDGTVDLYATNATIGDLDPTGVYAIEDTLNATSPGANESFTEIMSAPADSNIRGIAFAPVCFTSGTPIRTVRGDVAVEDLVVGDVVVTASGEPRAIKWLGHRTVDCERHPAPRDVKPIRVAADAFAPGRPAHDLYLSPGHSICVDLFGEVLIPVARLANGATIAQVDVPRVTYWHVELESHDILLAGNLPCESYIDCGTRAFFAESAAVSLHAAPDAPALTTDDYCRPFHPEGPLVDFTRERLCRRATDLGWRLETVDPLGGLYLEVDGRRVEPQCDGLVARVTLPVPVRQIWLCSESAVPADIHGATDERQLGLQLATATADDGLHWRCEIRSDDDRLWEGFHPHEGSLRWTDGCARLPAELWRGCRDMFVLRLAFAGPALPRWLAPAAEVAALDEAAAA